MHPEQETVIDHHDLDGVRAGVATGLFPMSLDLAGPRRRSPAFRFRGRVTRTGPLSVGEARYSAGLQIGMPAVGALYYVSMPGTGSALTAAHRGHSTTVSEGQGLLLGPGESATVETRDGYRSRVLMVDAQALERRWAALTGTPCDGPIRFAPRIQLATGAGAGWARMVRWFTQEVSTPGSLLSDPLINEPLQESLLTGLLVAAEHPHREALAEPDDACAPRHLRRAMAEVQAHAAEPLTVTRLAQAAGVSVRSLQMAFRQHLGTTPMQYVREVRLARAHDELRVADPGHSTVSQIAVRWGFLNVGRFSQQYAQRYRRYPSDTLRSL